MSAILPGSTTVNDSRDLSTTKDPVEDDSQLYQLAPSPIGSPRAGPSSDKEDYVDKLTSIPSVKIDGEKISIKGITFKESLQEIVSTIRDKPQYDSLQKIKKFLLTKINKQQRENKKKLATSTTTSEDSSFSPIKTRQSQLASSTPKTKGKKGKKRANESNTSNSGVRWEETDYQ